MISGFQGRELDARYLAYFDCFNRQLFFEAHEALEALWLQQRGGPKDRFYKGLIQLAGAFVHAQKGRRGPAAALLKLARSNLERYPAVYEELELARAQDIIELWLRQVETDEGGIEALSASQAPKLRLRC